MGEAKRRKSNDHICGKNNPNTSNGYVVCSYGFMKVFTNNTNVFSKDFITPGFLVENIDINKPQSINNWKDYFFTVNPDSKIIDLVEDNIYRINTHISAFQVYIIKKRNNNMVIKPTKNDKEYPDWIPFEIGIKIFEDAEVDCIELRKPIN